MPFELDTQRPHVGVHLSSAGLPADGPAALERCRSWLRDIAALSDGWDDEAARVIDCNALRTAEALLAQRPLLSAAYVIFPTETGGILFEFVANGWDLSIEVLFDGSIELFGFAKNGKAELLPFSCPDISAEFIERLDLMVGMQIE